VVTLHDLSSSCLILFRVLPETHAFCDAPLAPEPCLDCAARVFLGTPWLARPEQEAVLARLKRDVARELAAARAVVALSDDQARTLERLLGSPVSIRIVPPATEPPLSPVAPVPLDARGRPAPLVLGCWNTLHPLKGADLLIEAVRRLRDRGVPVELHLAGIEGDPGFAEQLRRSTQGLPVQFHGPFESLAGHRVTRVHAFVSGTLARETWGVVLDEAIALRLPMVLPRFGAYGTRLREGEGALFYERADARSLAEALERLWREPGLLEGLRARLPAREALLPSLESHARTYLELYHAAVSAGPPAVAPEDPLERAADDAYVARWDRGCAGA
jgi:glycosyltransferase involved in cell wall biosynthesis